jgi:hypothetical protein
MFGFYPGLTTCLWRGVGGPILQWKVAKLAITNTVHEATWFETGLPETTQMIARTLAKKS